MKNCCKTVYKNTLVSLNLGQEFYMRFNIKFHGNEKINLPGFSFLNFL
jgi:hypothetical protein